MTPSVEHLVAAGIKRDVAAQWHPYVVDALRRFDISTPNQVAAWIAQTAHESGGYTLLVENLNYRATIMAVVWPNRFAVLGPDKKPVKTPDGKNTPNKFALALERKPELLANVVYANRMGNGPTESGDGWKYRGRGLKQLTGKDNYRRCGNGLALDLLAKPEILQEPGGAALSAAWFWTENKCSEIIDTGDFKALTRKINGGTIGLEDRTKRYKAVLAAMGQS